MTLKDFLLSLLSGSFAIGPSIYAAFSYFDLLQSIEPRYKRVVIALISGVVGIGAWALAAALGYTPWQWDVTGVAEAIWNYGVLTAACSFMSSQILHGLTKEGQP